MAISDWGPPKNSRPLSWWRSHQLSGLTLGWPSFDFISKKGEAFLDNEIKAGLMIKADLILGGPQARLILASLFLCEAKKKQDHLCGEATEMVSHEKWWSKQEHLRRGPSALLVDGHALTPPFRTKMHHHLRFSINNTYFARKCMTISFYDETPVFYSRRKCFAFYLCAGVMHRGKPKNDAPAMKRGEMPIFDDKSTFGHPNPFQAGSLHTRARRSLFHHSFNFCSKN